MVMPELAEDFLCSKELDESQTRIIKSKFSTTLVANVLTKAFTSRPSANNHRTYHASCSHCRAVHESRKCPAFDETRSYCDKLNNFKIVCNAKAADETQSEKKVAIIRNVHHKTHQVTQKENLSVVFTIFNSEVKYDIAPIRLNSLSHSSNSIATHLGLIETEKPWFENILIEKKLVCFKLDPGSGIITLPKKLYLSLNVATKIRQSNEKVPFI